MKKFILILLLIYISIPCYRLGADIPISVLKIGVYNNPPKISVSEKGASSGFHIDLIEAILKDSPYRVEYHPGTWEEGLSRLKNGEIDIMPDVAWSEERSEIYDFNNEYVILNWACVYSSKNFTINTISDLNKKRVAVMKNSIHTEGEFGIINQAINFGINCEYIYVESYKEAFEMINNGSADAAVVNRLFGLMNEDNYNVRRTPIIFNPSQIKYAFSKKRNNNANLIKLFDSKIVELKNDKQGIYYKAYSKYLLPQIRKEKILPEWSVSIIFIAVIVSLIMSIYLLSARSGKNENILLIKFFRSNRSMSDIRLSIADNSLITFALFSVPLFLSILYHGMAVAWDNIIWFYLIAMLVPVMSAILRKHITVTIKIIILLISMFFTGILVFKSWGGAGTGFSFYLTAGIIITLVYGRRPGLAVITAGLITTILFLILIHYKLIRYNYDMVEYSQSPSAWIFAIMALFLMFFTIISGIEKFYENLIYSVNNLEQKVMLRTEDLDKVNISLMKEIELRKKIEEELVSAKLDAEHSSAAKGTFLASMSHEIRTPLNAILGYSQILLRDKKLPPESRREIEIINSSGEHLLGLINEILDMSKIEAGKTEVITETFSLLSVMKQIENIFSVKTNKKGIGFSINIMKNVPDIIISDKSKFKQIMINLIGNAVKFTDKGEVIVDVAMMDDTPEILKFTVSDTGKGIEPEDLDNIFAPFEQTVDGRDRGGTGLGLSISRKFAGLLGGDLNVKSVLNEGSLFTLNLPFKTGDADIYKEPEDENKITGIRSSMVPRVLIVDDREINRDILVRMLEPLGFPVKEASGGNEAIGLIKSWSPDIVLLDLIMPDMDGRDVIKIIKADPLHSGLKIIVVTASVLDIARDEILGLGVDAFIRKPFREIVVLNEIKDIFGLEYLYDKNETDDRKVPVIVTDDELAEMLIYVSFDIREYLKNALITGDIEEIHKAVEQISEIAPGLAKQINLLIDDFEFSSMIKILNNVDKH